MVSRKSILLTGATGLLGRYLLRDLLHSGRDVAVIARDNRSGLAEDRIREVVDQGGRMLGVRLPQPTVLSGDIREPGLGLSGMDRTWLAEHCGSVLHSAANVSFRRSPDGEPARTNTGGTKQLLELCTELGVVEFHYVSTAFVCGTRPSPALETDIDCGQGFNNDYERSKCQAEKLVRGWPGIRATVHRPSVIVGDSRTGYTSAYHGVYRFWEIADRIAEPIESPNDVIGRGGERHLMRRLPIRMPFHGEEARNLVPVDWVSRAIVEIVGRPETHGATYHLVARNPTRLREIRQVVQDTLGVEGLVLVGPGKIPNMTDIEQTYQDQLQEFIPYLDGDPDFDCRNTLAVLPHLPVPRVDMDSLSRMIRFAVDDAWGRRRRKKKCSAVRVDCADYVERHLPEGARQSRLARIPIDVTLGLEVRGPGGGRWFCRWVEGLLTEVCHRKEDRPEVTYRMDVATFASVISGKETPQAAFIGRRIEIRGSMDKGLKVAALFGQFVREFPYHLIPETSRTRE